jgi:hypothetical protein
MANPTVIDVAQQAPQFFDTLQAQQQQAFQGNQAALNAVSQAWAPVLQTGAVPYGFSAGLDNLLQSNVISTGTTAEVNAANAAALQQRQLAGGAPGAAPAGAQAQINADLAATSQQQIAKGLQAEKIAGYQQGVTNLEEGTKAELGIAGAEEAPQLGQAATGAGGLALSAGEAEFQENQQTSLMSEVGQGLDLAGKAVGVATGIGDVGSMFSNSMGNNPKTSAGISASQAAQPGVEDDLSYI